MKNLMFCALLITWTGASFAQGTWERKAEFPMPRWGAISFSIDNIGYIGTGASHDSARNDFWKYNPANDSWQQISSMPTLGRYVAFCFVIDNIAYVGAGINSLGLADFEFWSYDPIQDQWTKKNHLLWMNFADGTLTSFTIGHKGYLFSAFNQNNFKEYDPVTDTWTNLPSSPLNNLLSMVSFAIGEKGYIVAGYDGGHYDDNKQVWEYNTETYQWTRKADFPSPRVNGVGFSIGSKGYVGLGFSRAGYRTDFWEYDPISDYWLPLTDCPLVSIYGTAFTIGSKGYVGTGVSIDGKQMWEYTPESSSTNNVKITNELKLFPNPVRDRLRIAEDFFQPLQSTIIGSDGRTFYHCKIIDQSIDVSELPAGTYLLKCTTSKGEVLIGKFFKVE